MAGGLPVHFLQKLAHGIELRAEAFPVAGLQSLHRLIVAIKRLARLICRRAYSGVSSVAPEAAGAAPGSAKSADKASASVSFITTCSP